MRSIPAPTTSSFQEFAARVTDAAFVDRLARETSWDVDALRTRLTIAVGEAAQTLRVLAGIQLDDDDRIIEIGAGLGLTSTYLSTCGFDVTALEPAGTGFEEHDAVAGHVAALVGSSHQVLTIPAENLVEGVHGRFGLVFSNNVLEHVVDPALALSSLAAVLTDDGVMVHSCPNYSIPYEPHFGIPLVPLRPAWTRRVLPASIGDSAVWRSLNFVRARDVTRASKSLGLTVHFRSGSLATSLERLSADPDFGARHRALAFVAGALGRLRVIPLLRRLPATWSTPMDFLVCRPGLEEARVTAWLDPSTI